MNSFKFLLVFVSHDSVEMTKEHGFTCLLKYYHAIAKKKIQMHSANMYFILCGFEKNLLLKVGDCLL